LWKVGCCGLISSTYLDSWSNEISQRNLAEKPANFASCRLLYATLEWSRIYTYSGMQYLLHFCLAIDVSGNKVAVLLETKSQYSSWAWRHLYRSFHYWQPALRWRVLPWLTNPGNPTRSHEREDKISGKRVGWGGRNTNANLTSAPSRQWQLLILEPC